MSVDLSIYRARIGIHRFRLFKIKGLGKFNNFETLLFLSLILYQAGDIERNPGPQSVDSNETSSSSHFPVFQGNFSMVHYNVQSLQHKIDILEPELSTFDLVSFTETWLNDSILSEDLLLHDFRSPFRRDRIGDSHGGIIVYVKNDIPCKRRQDLELLNIECVWLELNIKNRKLLVGTFYRPPSSSPQVLIDIENSIGLAVDTGITDIVITGDFNLNMINPQSEKKVLDICKQYNLHQLINEPTHFTESSSSLIDLILVSNRQSIEMFGVGEPILMQDIRYHCPVYSIFNFKKSISKSFQRKVWLYEKGNYDELRNKVSDFDWNTVQNEDINQYALNFSNKLLEIASECIPTKFITVRPKDLPWMNNNIRKLMRKRNRLYKKYKTNKSPDKYNSYKKIRNEVIQALRKSKKDYVDSLAYKLKNTNFSSKDYWKTLKSFIKPTQNASIPPLLHESIYYSDSMDKANILNDFFVAQTILDDHNATIPDNVTQDTFLDTISITSAEVKSVLQTLKLGKSSGPDTINNRILKELAAPLSQPLCELFNFSLMKCVCPSIWKEANVSPLFKKDDPSLVINYRPISLLNTIGKVMEKIIHKHIFNFFKQQNVITCLQSGFVPGDSTTNQLVEIYNTFCKALDEGKEVRAIFCDISKAFDRVWHKGLLFKLKNAGINGCLLQWLSSYLSDRKQRVVIPGASSDWAFIQAGVPQGSILGPLLFLLYINDIVVNINANVRLFADDTSLYLIVNDPNETATILNDDLETIHKWAETWLVKFNPSKSESLILSRKTNANLHPPLVMNNEHIKEVTHHKHLGLFLSNDGTWHEHIDYITSKAWQRVNIMRKLKFLLDRESLQIIYTSFIRPILEYSDIVWDNITQYEVNALQKIQNEAARIVTGATKLVSLDMLNSETCWESLQARRSKHKLCTFYKMKNNLSPAYLSSLVPESFESTTYNLRDSQNIRPILTRTQLYYRSFLPSSIRDWNELPIEVRNSTSLASFKFQLNRDIPKIPKYYYTGNRFLQIQHTRLRTGCSSLNQHLFSKNIIDNPFCVCGSVESTKHYLFDCIRYQHIRTNMINVVSVYCTPSLNVLLSGDSHLDNHTNERIFLAVQRFIDDSRRFHA
ncbi:MAG: reverse transcriptase family protein [Candidatus Thiodiazotropha sp.]